MVEFQSLDLLIRFGKEFGHRQIRGNGFNETEFLICSFIMKNPRCSQLDAVNGLKMDKTTLAKALNVLENKGYVRRVQDTKDRRVNRLQVTEEGAEHMETLLGLHDQWMKSILTVLNDKEQKQMDNYIRRLLEAAENLKTEE